MQTKIRLIPGVLMLIVAIILACSSTPLTPEQQYELDVKHELERVKYNRMVRECGKANGILVVDRRGASRMRRRGEAITID